MDLTTDGRAAAMKSWQRRILASIWITYFTYYFCRLNMPVAGTPLRAEFSWSQQEFGIVLSALTLMYAVGQFVNGQLADWFGARRIATIGALGSVAMNLAVFALTMGATGAMKPSTILLCLAIFWGANGFFQAMGWAPMVRMMAHWFSAEHRGKAMGLLGTCYQFGAAVASLLALFLTGYYASRLHGDWRIVFLVPAAVLAIAGAMFYVLSRDRPEDVGLPAVDPETTASSGAAKPTIAGNIQKTLTNRNLWVIAGAFMLLDFNRYGFVNWLPAFLQEQNLEHSSPLMKELQLIAKVCVLPLGGSAGAIVAGWATDRFFGSRRAPVIAILLALLGVLSIIFPMFPAQNTIAVMTVVALIGFCTYGPHILMVGHAAQDFGKKSGAAGAAGFIDAMGYLGATAAGMGAGAVISAHGYHVAFTVFGVAAILGALLACAIWKANPNIAKDL